MAATTTPAAAGPAGAGAEPKRKPGWMSIPGGPKEPNYTDYRTKFNALLDKKKECFEKLKTIREEFDAARGNNGERSEADRERQTLRQDLSKLDEDRRKERQNRKTADEKIKGVRNERIAIQRQLQDLQDDVGAFTDVAEIDAAIDLVMLKMETGTSSLRAEKECIKRLAKLEDAKSLLQKLEPLEEAIADAEERELDLQQESRSIHTRISELNENYDKVFKAKLEKDKLREKNTFDFSALHARRDVVSKEIDALNAQITEMRTAFDEQVEAWKQWKIEAQEKFQAKMDAERAEREKAWKERQEAQRLERRRKKAAKKMNPFKFEIDACATLVQYLEQKVKSHQRDVEEAEKRKKLAAFDPAAAAPAGTKVASAETAEAEDAWLFSDRAGKNKKGGNTKTQKKPAQEKKGDAPIVSADSKKKAVFHSQDKREMFAKVEVAAPQTYGDFEVTLKKLKEKKTFYESKIIVNPDDVALTDSDSEGEGAEEGDAQPKKNAPVADQTTIVASTAAATDF